MKCRQCGNPVHECVLRCNYCNSYHYAISRSLIPPIDMFENPAFPLVENEYKKQARTEMLWNNPVYRKFVEDEKKAKKNYILYIILALACGFFATFGVYVFAIILALLFKNSIILSIVVIASEILSLIGLILFCILSSKCISNVYYSDYYMYHRNPKAYYASPLVIGYAIPYYNRRVSRHSDNCYNFCELDKRNIRGISYDYQHREFVLHTHQPVYVAYYTTNDKRMEFRIPDIFEDQSLSAALGVDVRFIRDRY